MQYHIMHRNDIIAKADENLITQILNRDLCPACFAVGMPLNRWLDDRTVDIHRSHSRRLFKALRLKSYAIDMKRGNLFTEDILNQDLCCRVLNDSLPERDRIVNAVMYASEETRKVFELPDFNYSLLEDYITDTYDYFVSQKNRIKQFEQVRKNY